MTEQAHTGSDSISTAVGAGQAHSRLRLFQVFVNSEGIRVPIRHPLLNFLPWRYRPAKTFGFYAVLMLAADEGTLPPMLLSMAQQVLAEQFGQMSRTEPADWVGKMVQWREVGVAPPMFQQPGCIDDGWGAAWYEFGDEKTKAQRYRLTKLRLWKGRRAKARGLQLYKGSKQSPRADATAAETESMTKEKNLAGMQPL